PRRYPERQPGVTPDPRDQSPVSHAMVDEAISLISDRLERARERHASLPAGTAARIDAADDVRRLESTLGELSRLRDTAVELLRSEVDAAA
ncbi:MAG TPA: hypothetical protein VFR93_05250, partial [Candidatus Limnocylindrales bacterium]|nr:hypothetical protein [Candidatus Limnocylindrales bacterium]